MREDGAAELAHGDFLKKVVKVIGLEAAGKLSGSYKGRDGTTRRCFNLPKREAHLIVMSEIWLKHLSIRRQE